MRPAVLLPVIVFFSVSCAEAGIFRRCLSLTREIVTIRQENEIQSRLKEAQAQLDRLEATLRLNEGQTGDSVSRSWRKQDRIKEKIWAQVEVLAKKNPHQSRIVEFAFKNGNNNRTLKVSQKMDTLAIMEGARAFARQGGLPNRDIAQVLAARGFNSKVTRYLIELVSEYAGKNENPLYIDDILRELEKLESPEEIRSLRGERFLAPEKLFQMSSVLEKMRENEAAEDSSRSLPVIKTDIMPKTAPVKQVTKRGAMLDSLISLAKDHLKDALANNPEFLVKVFRQKGDAQFLDILKQHWNEPGFSDSLIRAFQAEPPHAGEVLRLLRLQKTVIDPGIRHTLGILAKTWSNLENHQFK